MIYVMSDIHGCYDEYLKMLEKINFSDNDTLYIVGDVCERGPKVIDVLLHMMEHKNIIPIWGNHDLSTFNYLCIIKNHIDDVLYNKNYLIKHKVINASYYFKEWYYQEYETLLAFRDLNSKKREDLINYFYSFKDYININLNGKDYILVHGGIPDDENDISSILLDDLVWCRPNFRKKRFENSIIVCGHTPTITFNYDGEAKIFKDNNYFAIDCGAVFGYKLACLCLDNGREFYVDCNKYY